jgi:hypothetical protein
LACPPLRLFEVADQDGKVLTKFQSRKAYSGGAGIGGFDLVDMQDLARKLGEDTAESIVRWSLTGKLEE